jgi:hypothetical protein
MPSLCGSNIPLKHGRCWRWTAIRLSVFLTWIRSINKGGQIVMDGQYSVQLTIFARKYGAFFAAMDNLKGCFLIKR